MLVPVCPSQCRAARAGITSSSLSVVTDSDIVRRTIGRVCAGGAQVGLGLGATGTGRRAHSWTVCLAYDSTLSANLKFTVYPSRPSRGAEPRSAALLTLFTIHY